MRTTSKLASTAALLLALLVAACVDDDQAEGCTSAEECRLGTGGAPVDACKAIDGEKYCVYTCTNDDDCLAPFHGPCSARTDDGTKVCAAAGDDAADGGSAQSRDD